MAATAPETAAERSHPLAVQAGYSIANLGKSVVWTSFESIMLFYLVWIAGFGPLAAGALLAVALVWDAAFDLTVARWTDRRGGTNDLARLVVIGAPLCGVGFWLIFMLHAPGAVAAAIIACRIGYSLCDVGHNTLLIRVARAPGDATRVSGMRLLCSASGVALLALVSGASLSLAQPEAQRQSLAAGAMMGGGLYIATLFVALAATRRLSQPVRRRGITSVRRPLSAYWRNLPFRRLLLLTGVQASMVPLFQRALPFYGVAVFGDAGWAGPALLTMTVAQAAALPGWMAVGRRWTPRRIAMAAHGGTIVAMVGLAVAPGTACDMAMLVMLGVAVGGMNIAIWALLTEMVHRSMADGASDEATPVGLFLAVLKTGAAMGNLLLAGIVAAGPVALPLGGMTTALLPASAIVVPICGSLAALCLLFTGRYGIAPDLPQGAIATASAARSYRDQSRPRRILPGKVSRRRRARPAAFRSRTKPSGSS
jgi:Na+/melibiose symporter-like transporter